MRSEAFSFQLSDFSSQLLTFRIASCLQFSWNELGRTDCGGHYFKPEAKRPKLIADG
jgi:hypothetical protein